MPKWPMQLAAQVLALACTAAAADEPRRNPFDDPFTGVTQGLANCPVAEPPLFTEEQIRNEAHDRSQRGTSCWLAGRCRLHNAYLYDKEIIPRVVKAVRADGRYADTTVWALGQRRWVWLKGCVATPQQRVDLERLVRLIDDVEGVVNELMVGNAAKPPYKTAAGR
ncbi:MAG: BON domain-containing protein [Burkholderiaceae bacterium]|nr:BON domain-containing protein [Burkholderiaceae bacterium]